MHETPTSIEEFQTLLLDVSLEASHVVGHVTGPGSQERAEDARSVWHAAEVALGILLENYHPKKETLADVRALLTRY